MLKVDVGRKRVVELARDALSRGGKLASVGRRSSDPTVIEWKVSGRCEQPVSVWLHGTLAKDREKGVEYAGLRDIPDPVAIDMAAPCRRCEPCLKVRGSQWRQRAMIETLQSPRTWRVTLTFSAEEHWRITCEAREAHRKAGKGDFPTGGDKLLLARHGIAGKLVTRFLKRLRVGGYYRAWDSRLRTMVDVRQEPTRFRYVVVLERHDGKRRKGRTGFVGQALPPDSPHYHLLIHELPGQPPLREAFIRQEWAEHHGWLKAKLVDEPAKAAGYAAKYISKEALARVRASVGYGYQLSEIADQYITGGSGEFSSERPARIEGEYPPIWAKCEADDPPPRGQPPPGGLVQWVPPL